jgi:hypothetical protein
VAYLKDGRAVNTVEPLDPVVGAGGAPLNAGFSHALFAQAGETPSVTVSSLQLNVRGKIGLINNNYT